MDQLTRELLRLLTEAELTIGYRVDPEDERYLTLTDVRRFYRTEIIEEFQRLIGDDPIVLDLLTDKAFNEGR